MPERPVGQAQADGEVLKSDAQKAFLRDEFLSLTLQGALGLRGSKIYKEDVGEKDKECFRQSLREWLLKRESAYGSRVQVQESEHEKNIKQLADELTKKHANILANGCFRLGIAQKALNLYLKYLWCMDRILVEPPHCPFDSRIIKELPNCNLKWTTLETMADYKWLVAAAREKAGGYSLAVWELLIFNSSRNRSSATG